MPTHIRADPATPADLPIVTAEAVTRAPTGALIERPRVDMRAGKSRQWRFEICSANGRIPNNKLTSAGLTNTDPRAQRAPVPRESVLEAGQRCLHPLHNFRLRAIYSPQANLSCRQESLRERDGAPEEARQANCQRMAATVK